ncbi:MAG: hypothetical protein CMJ58_03780 [Planctomycetaceae bacterium]|nr:hypothetical protein [Planctomycetaceae bacterium]
MVPSRTLSTLVSGWFTAVALGVPLPAPTAPVRSGERFPCESCGCGCATAEHCWRDCCCFAPAERLSWARREGVRPPQFALDDARRAGIEIAHWAEVRSGAKAPPTVAAVKAPVKSAPAKSCCCGNSCDDSQVAASEPPEQTQVRRTASHVNMLQSLACRGLRTTWLTLGAVIVPPVFEASVEQSTSAFCALLPLPVEGPAPAIPTPPPQALA